MSIVNWFETDVKIPPGGVYEHNCSGGTNVVQIINRRAAGGGNIFADTRASLKQDYYLVRVDQGKNGTIAHPKQIDKIYLMSDSGSDVYVSVLEIVANNLDMVYNASQIVQMTGAVTVSSMPNVTVSSMPEIEIKNDAGNPVPISLTAALPTGTNTIGTVNIGTQTPTPAGTNNIGKVDVNLLPALPAGANTIGTVNVGTFPALPTGANTIGTVNVVRTTYGTNANAWNNIAVSAGGASTGYDVQYAPNVAAFGFASAATTISIQVSMDNINYYESGINKVLAAAGDFYMSLPDFGARYVRLKSTAAATITATLAGKVG